MTCAQGLLRLLWGGPRLECYGTGQEHHKIKPLIPGSINLTFFYEYEIAYNRFILQTFIITDEEDEKLNSLLRKLLLK